MKSLQIKTILLFGMAVLFMARCNDPKDTPCIYNDERLCDQAYLDSIREGGDGVDTIAFNEDLTNYDENILLEEFTGFRCTNCPAATAEANNLKNQYPDRLFLSSIHCMEQFAAPLPVADDPEGQFQIDLRTPEGGIWLNYYSVVGLPDGMINRLGNEFGPTISSAFWAGRVAELIAENNPEVYIKITDVDVIEGSKPVARIHATVKPLILEDDDYYINTWVLEDSIVAGQKNNTGTIYNYVHNHVFRHASNGPWGQLAYRGDITLDANTALDFQMSIPLDDSWRLNHCNIMVVVSRESTREIIQVDEVPLYE